MNKMNRRAFLAGMGSVAAGMMAVRSGKAQTVGAGAASAPFKLKYAPHFGMFENLAGKDLLDQLRFAYDQGFRAWEDNGMPGRPAQMQEKIGAEMTRLGMEMGVFVATADFDNVTFASDDPAVREKLVADMRNAVEVARRVNAKWCTVVPGQYDRKLPWDYQTANVIENLKHCAAVCEPVGLIMVLEPLNPYTDHPGLFLTKISQAYQICRAVNSPSCKILDDLYHQQVTEGNLIPNLDRAWSEIAYFQVGDNPGRKEPGTGEINFRNIFRHLYSKGYTGIIGMEHGIAGEGKNGELALIEAYRAADDFPVS